MEEPSSSNNKFTTIELNRSSTTLIVGDNGAINLLYSMHFVLFYGKGFEISKKTY